LLKQGFSFGQTALLLRLSATGFGCAMDIIAVKKGDFPCCRRGKKRCGEKKEENYRDQAQANRHGFLQVLVLHCEAQRNRSIFAGPFMSNLRYNPADLPMIVKQ